MPQLILSSILLGLGLAMDAFSVSLANGLAEPQGSKVRTSAIAGTFALFQAAMPLIGWFLVHNLARLFEKFQKLIPFIALGLLLFIGGKMLIEGIGEVRGKGESENEGEKKRTGLAALLIQGVATSIDALSVGFTIAEYNVWQALLSAGIISVVTFALCFAGVEIGKKFGTKFAGKATILGGVILIAIGIEIFITGLIG